MKPRAVALGLLAAVLAIGAARQARGASLDPLLLPVLSGHAAPQLLGPVTGAAASDDAGEPRLSVSLRFSGSLDELRSTGIRFSGSLGDVATADVSVAQLRVLAAHPQVRSIEAARLLKPQLDVTAIPTHTAVSLLRTRAGDGWTATSYTGRGVLIGIIDSGLDLRHDDFLRPDGTTRVLALWDQSTAEGRSPRGFSYGAECTAEQINVRDCPQVDRLGHGTHVAGIAAGDGSATSGDEPAYRYVGMAPEADLLVVKLGSFTSTQVIDALSYLKNKTETLGKPIVVNMSFGSTLGPHDGTMNLDRAVDAFTGPDDLPGAVAVVSAGNDGQTGAGNPLHAVGCFQTGSPAPSCNDLGVAPLPGAIPATSVSFAIPEGATSAVIEMWYTGTAALGVAVTAPSECATAKATPAGPAIVSESTPCGSITISAGDVQPNGDRWTAVVLTSGSEIRSGIWNLSITGDTLPASGATRFDLWSSVTPSEKGAAFTPGSAETTITMPASAAEAISVTPYVSKDIWTSIDPTCSPCQLSPAEGTLGAIWSRASRGPLRPCSACDQSAKPDLAAPGTVVKSSLSSRIPDDPENDKLVDPDRRHWAQLGSSMAAPHVTGTAALLLQINPNLTAREVKAYLLSGVSPPQVPPPFPTEQWGSGRLNAQSAVDALKAAAGGDPPPTAPAGFRVTSVRSERVVLAWDPSADLDLQYYQVFRRDTAGVTTALAPTLAPTATTFEDTTALTNEAAYVYTIQAVDIGGASGTLSAEARAVPTAGEGSVGFCFIATAAYGSAWHPHVASLREFRDRRMRPYALGRAAIAGYETLSPPIARVIAPHPWLRAVVRGALTPIVLTIEHPRASAALAGLAALGAIGLAVRRRPSRQP